MPSEFDFRMIGLRAASAWSWHDQCIYAVQGLACIGARKVGNFVAKPQTDCIVWLCREEISSGLCDGPGARGTIAQNRGPASIAEAVHIA